MFLGIKGGNGVYYLSNAGGWNKTHGQVEQSRVIRTPLPLRMPVKYRPSRSSVTGSGCRTGKTMSMGTGV